MKRLSANIMSLMILVFWLNQDASPADKIKIRNKWKVAFNDNAYISTANLPTWYVIANTNVRGWACVVNETNLERLKANPANYSKAAFDSWKTTNLDNPNHFQVRSNSSNDWRAVQAAEGMATYHPPEQPE